jgi:hypothetical protein
MIFLLLLGSAVIAIPVGLAMLSLTYQWAKIALRKSQCYFCQAAVKTAQDLFWLGGNYVVNDR